MRKQTQTDRPEIYVDTVDLIKNLNPAREENETFEEYKTRRIYNEHILTVKRRLMNRHTRDYNTNRVHINGQST